MGCDIHMQVELFDWVPTEDGKDEVQRWVRVIAEPAAYGDRNYALFGVLAGVRCTEIPCIAAPRGLPQDVSREVKADADRWDVDGHNHSWVTLKEVLDFDWAKPAPYTDAPTCAEACSDFLKWARELTTGPTRLSRRNPGQIRFVFWFDN